MISIYDYVTVGCFVVMVGAFLFVTRRDPQTLAHLMISAVLFAIANQLGNAGSNALAVILIVAGIVYAVIIVGK